MSILFDMPKSQNVISGKRVETRQITTLTASRSMHLIKALDEVHLSELASNAVMHIVTQGAINAFSFVQYFCVIDTVKSLDIAIYRIGMQTLNDLLYLMDRGRIEQCNILVNDNTNRMKPQIWSKLIDESKKRDNFNVWAQNSHAKIIVVETDRHYVIEGSGNLSDNARVEQYTVTKSRELAEWHREWLRVDYFGKRKVSGK